MEKSNAVIAVFPDQKSAESAVKTLTAAGFATNGLYDAALRADNFLVMAHGPAEDISRAKKILIAAKPASIDLYPPEAAERDSEPAEEARPEPSPESDQADPVLLWNASDIEGCAIAATDGQLGTVSDLLFDDFDWSVRWLVVKTGRWLVGRKVLIPVIALGGLVPRLGRITVGLTMQQVKESPDIYAHKPVSRRMESNLLDHYDWSRNLVGAESWRAPRNPQLCSVGAVRGYRIRASDGDIGHLKDVLLEDSDWSIHYLVVDAQNWWPGKTVLVAPKSAKNIDWATNRIDLDVDRQKVKNSPDYDPSRAMSGAYERNFHRYYGDSQGKEAPPDAL